MTPHGLDATVDVGLSLERDGLPSVPADPRSELRAGVKILHSAASELNVMNPLLRQECTALLALQDESAAPLTLTTAAQSSAALRARLADTSLDLRALFALHEDVLQATTAHMAVLLKQSASAGASGARNRALLSRYYQTLAQHALRRLPWQSVFTGPLAAQPA